MNHIYNNTHQRERSYAFFENKMAADGKKGLTVQPDSLFSMALYDLESVAHHESNQHQHQQSRQSLQPLTAAFHPVEEYKEISLKEILDISDDFLFGDEDAVPNPTPIANNNLPYQDMSFASRVQQPEQQQAQSLPTVAPPAPVPVSSYPVENPQDMHHPALDLAPSNKRNRDAFQMGVEDEDSADDQDRRFRPYQAGQWAEKFEELCEYRNRVGHCLVPHTYKENLPLARWVKRQRYQYKLMMEGKASTMTPERVQALEDIGFIWDSQGAAWAERLDELREFRKTYYHCNVPSNYSENPQLATWVKCQRRQYKLHMEGKASNMTEHRIRELESLGFEWELRSYKRARVC